jgi:hypothetical protein
MTYDEALEIARAVRLEIRAVCGDDEEQEYRALNKRAAEDEQFEKALQLIGFRRVVVEQQTRH